MVDLEEIKRLVEKYQKLENNNQLSRYNEENTKKDFIIPLFRALGWNTEDSSEVTAEEQVSKKRVDYCFKIDDFPQFYLEAKSIKENLAQPKYVEQAINYAWLKGCTWAVLTNFKTLKIFNAEWKAASYLQSHLKTIEYNEYIDRIDELSLLSKLSFKNNLLDNEAEKWGKKTSKTAIDKQLLMEFTRFRSLLSEDINKLNKGMELLEEEIDECVQRILDRLIFIRTCEDKEIEPPILISKLREWEDKGKGRLINKIREEFEYFDELYNSKIFAPHICDNLIINNLTIREIIQRLYYSNDGIFHYDFSAIDADVLGIMYEQYLSHILNKEHGKTILTENTLHKKLQGVYYTPTFVVDFMVNTSFNNLKRKNLNNVKILDLTCGSGSFLLKTYDYLYKKIIRDKKLDQTKLDIDGGIFTTKVNILKNNLFGVDLDKQSISISQLNLLLRITEKKQRLPLLEKNIKWGNSLVSDTSIIGNAAFHWEENFHDVLSVGGFDIIIGNPPYVGWSSINSTERVLYENGQYLDVNYSCRPNHKDAQPNYYLFFIVRATNLLNKKGILSYILPQEWLYHNYAQDFRNYLLDNYKEIEIIKFNPKYKVFKTLGEIIGTNSLILTCKKLGNGKIIHHSIDDLTDTEVLTHLKQNEFDETIILKMSELYDKPWIIVSKKIQKIKTRINKNKGNLYLSDKKHFEVRGGFQPPVIEAKKFEIDNNTYNILSDYEKEKCFNLVLDSSEMKRYKINVKNKKYWILLNDVEDIQELKSNYNNLYKILHKNISTKTGKWWHFPNIRNFTIFKQYDKKILSPRTSDMSSFSLDEEKSVFKGTNTMIISKTLSPYYVIGILNSQLSNFWYANFGYDYHGDKTKKYEPAKAKKYLIPIRKTSKENTKRLIVLTKKIISKHNELSTTKKLTDKYKEISLTINTIDSKIDELVYNIYNLKDNVREVIQNNIAV